METAEIRKLSDAELTVMMALWSADQPVPRSWLEERLVEKKWNTKTVNTYLTRLAEKGAVTVSGREKPTSTPLPIPGRPIWNWRTAPF